MLRKHAASYGTQWDKYLHGVVWAYRNVPHESTSEKPSYLLFGRDCRYPIEAAFLPVTEPELTDVSDYRSELVTTLSQARDLAVQSIQEAQHKYKRQYDKVNKCMRGEHKIGSWVLIRFPQEESGGLRKLSRPWHGPYRVIEVTPTGITAERVYTSTRNPIRVHLRRVSRCPPNFPAGYFWYGDRRNGLGRLPNWIKNFVEVSASGAEPSNGETDDPESTQSSTTREVAKDVDISRDSTGTNATSHSKATHTRTRIITPPDCYK